MSMLAAASFARAVLPSALGAVGGVEPDKVLLYLLLDLAIIIIAARALGSVARRLGQPSVVGEIIAGIVMGPTVLGRINGDWPGAVFPSYVPLKTLADLGLIFFMFLVGLELDTRLMRSQGRRAVQISLSGIVLPLVLGMTVGYALYSVNAGGTFLEGVKEPPDRWTFALFVGAAMCITAFPVLARILVETNLHKTAVGTAALCAAAVDDAIAWILLAAVVGIVENGSPLQAGRALLLTLVFVIFMATVGSRILDWVAKRSEASGGLSLDAIALVLAGVLLSAVITQKIGIHAIFGAFIFGAIMPKRSTVTHDLTDKVEDFTVIVLLPVFFAVTGLRTNLLALDSISLGGWTLLILGAAVVGKFAGCSIAARVTGSSTRDSVIVGALMNTRGLTELVILTIGRDLGVLSDRTFAMMVIMALSTTVMAAPIVNRLMPRKRLLGEIAHAALILPQSPYLQRLDAYGTPVEVVEIGSSLTLGRAFENGLVLADDALASRRHAMISGSGGGFDIRDLDSTNGIMIWRSGRWRPVNEHEDLREQDLFVVGASVFQFSSGAGVKAP